MLTEIQAVRGRVLTQNAVLQGLLSTLSQKLEGAVTASPILAVAMRDLVKVLKAWAADTTQLLDILVNDVSVPPLGLTYSQVEAAAKSMGLEVLPTDQSLGLERESSSELVKEAVYPPEGRRTPIEEELRDRVTGLTGVSLNLIDVTSLGDTHRIFAPGPVELGRLFDQGDHV